MSFIQIIGDSGSIINLPDDSHGVMAKAYIDQLKKRVTDAEDTTQKLTATNTNLTKEVTELTTKVKGFSDAATSMPSEKDMMRKVTGDMVKAMMHEMGCAEEDMEEIDLSDIGAIASYFKNKMGSKLKKDSLDNEVTGRVQTYFEIAPFVGNDFPYDPSWTPSEIKRQYLVYRNPALKDQLTDGVDSDYVNGYYECHKATLNVAKSEPKTVEQRRLIDLRPKGIQSDAQGNIFDANDAESVLAAAIAKRTKAIESNSRGV